MISTGRIPIPCMLEVGGFWGHFAQWKTIMALAFFSAMTRHVSASSDRRLYRMSKEDFKPYIRDYLCILSTNHSQEKYNKILVERLGCVPHDRNVRNKNSGNLISWFTMLWKADSVNVFFDKLLDKPTIMEAVYNNGMDSFTEDLKPFKEAFECAFPALRITAE